MFPTINLRQTRVHLHRIMDKRGISQLLRVPIDVIICGNRKPIMPEPVISQLHNYFIHRLVNEEDLRKIYRTIAFSDKSTNEMIPILPAGCCVFAGLASSFPILARVSILPEKKQPQSENVDIQKIWY